MPEKFGMGLDIKGILAKNVPNFVPIALHHFFCEKDTACDAMTENIFLRSIAGRPGKILTCPLPLPLFILNLCLPLNTVTTSPKLRKQV